jgi:hypothetical protein
MATTMSSVYSFLASSFHLKKEREAVAEGEGNRYHYLMRARVPLRSRVHRAILAVCVVRLCTARPILQAWNLV